MTPAAALAYAGPVELLDALAVESHRVALDVLAGVILAAEALALSAGLSVALQDAQATAASWSERLAITTADTEAAALAVREARAAVALREPLTATHLDTGRAGEVQAEHARLDEARSAAESAHHEVVAEMHLAAARRGEATARVAGIKAKLAALDAVPAPDVGVFADALRDPVEAQ